MNLQGCNKATHLCPCGYYNDPSIQCRCGADQILRYQSRVSGPFLDRIDLHLELQREVHVDGVLASNANNEPSQVIRKRVIRARQIQLERQEINNAALDAQGIRCFSMLDESAISLLQQASLNLSLSLRVQHRLIRVARTIADLDEHVNVSDEHLAEGLSYRRMTVLNAL